jgi:hypothetical protein
METKTEIDTMTNFQIVEGKQAQDEYERTVNRISTFHRDEYNTPNQGASNMADLKRENRTVFFYTRLRFAPGKFDSNINTFAAKSCIQKTNYYDLIRFFTSSSVIECRNVYCVKGGFLQTFFGSEHKINFDGRPCILTIDDFTQDFKMSEDSIGIKIGKMVDMNNRKHNQMKRQEQRIREQESQMTLMQSIISSMQNQLQEQYKLIASLQSRLVVKEKVEVDMFADWLKDEEEEPQKSENEEEEPQKSENEIIVPPSSETLTEVVKPKKRVSFADTVTYASEEDEKEETEIVYTRNTGPVRIVDYNKGSSFEVIGDLEKHYHSLIKLQCKWSMLKNQETGEKYYGWLFDYSKKRLIENWIEEGCLTQAEAEEKRREKRIEEERKQAEEKRAEDEEERKRAEINQMKRANSIKDLERRIEENKKERMRWMYYG